MANTCFLHPRRETPDANALCGECRANLADYEDERRRRLRRFVRALAKKQVAR
jgi:hypothetical protein